MTEAVERPYQIRAGANTLESAFQLDEVNGCRQRAAEQRCEVLSTACRKRRDAQTTAPDRAEALQTVTHSVPQG